MCIDGSGLVDRVVGELIPGPDAWPEFYEWARTAFALSDASWSAAGGGDPGDGDRPYGKLINAIYLLAFALRDDPDRSWHGGADYLGAALALENDFHGAVTSLFDGTDDGEATARTGSPTGRDVTSYHCRVFDLGGASDDPANRASVMVHEGWHHWQHAHGWQTDHVTGGAIAAGREGDWYYLHRVATFGFGELWRYDLRPVPIAFHSPYQVQVEFCGDLAEFAQPWVPLGVCQSARSYGNTRLAAAFKNTVAYRIGDPRPF